MVLLRVNRTRVGLCSVCDNYSSNHRSTSVRLIEESARLAARNTFCFPVNALDFVMS